MESERIGSFSDSTSGRSDSPANFFLDGERTETNLQYIIKLGKDTSPLAF